MFGEQWRVLEKPKFKYHSLQGDTSLEYYFHILRFWRLGGDRLSVRSIFCFLLLILSCVYRTPFVAVFAIVHWLMVCSFRVMVILHVKVHVHIIFLFPWATSVWLECRVCGFGHRKRNSYCCKATLMQTLNCILLWIKSLRCSCGVCTCLLQSHLWLTYNLKSL
jgi:hypothetical protein